MRKTIVVAAMLLACAGMARPQTVDFNRQRVPMADLTGPWRFHAGDDSAWASPAFDDSHWSLLTADKSWSEQGYSGLDIGWYRLRIAVPRQSDPLALYLPDVEDSFQIFANGRMIGQVGDLPPHPKFVLSERNIYPIPADTMPSNQSLELAVRVWRTPLRGANGGGIDEVPRIGGAHQMAEWRRLQVHYVVSLVTGDIAEFLCNILTALAGIGLFLLRPKERGYLWWGVSQSLWALFIFIQFFSEFRNTPYFPYLALDSTVMALAMYFQFQFYITFLRQRRDWLFWLGIGIQAGSLAADFLSVAAVRSETINLLAGLGPVLIQASFVAVLWRGARKNRTDAALLLVPNCIMLALQTLDDISRLQVFSSMPWSEWMRNTMRHAISWPFVMRASDLAGLFEMFAVLVILLRSYVRTREDEERLESELEAARAVQNVLIPNESPAIPGFVVETVYHPASQVGGDFFQIMPVKTGGALLVIGDVSGKGMPAAMTVSLLVGTVRTLAHYTQSPGEILAAMNLRMLARSSGGFTTCLVMRVDPDGMLTAANAGHLAPYLNGMELKLENGLPLGLTADAQYAESTFRLVTPARLTLLTDGVVEARNHGGELFGFGRAAAISTESANQIAHAAEEFGQEDDITVLTLSLSAAEAMHA